ncbi:thioredoxin family protein [Balneolaceae bacterium YR4-1]|uniref:Thioredoxin family protein n=1 Tax=Halalkalibaculum roseum TaxID=2709311 RepID=A0A6M1T2R0_9BACT|nr:thioredoxin family protein [Halalkalibaculum roseum]NGP77057.1 thioredoxin family protein [Halalkalibaculum roseum]
MDTTTEKLINQELIADSFTYRQYRQLIDKRLERGRTTSDKDSEEILEYTRMNVRRMNRLDDQVTLNTSLQEKLENLDDSWIWLVITEGWCGDAAQNIPAINKMAEVASNIELRFILRDENPEIMDQYLTNGSRSIPKLICLDAESLEQIGTWGPRPSSIQEKAMEWKDDPEISMEEWAEKLHKYYADDKTEELQQEFEELIEEWS